MKHTQTPSVEASSSKKKTQRELATKILSQRTSSLGVDPESAQVGSTDKDYAILSFSRSHPTKGPAVITTEAGPMGVTKIQTSRGKSVSVSIRVVPSISF